MASRLHLVGVRVSDADALWIADRLDGDSGPGAAAAAAAIRRGVDRELYAVALDEEMRCAILAVLDDPPDGLVELRGELLRDLRGRGHDVAGPS